MDIQKIVEKQHAFFNTQTTKDLFYRLNALKTLQKAIIAHESKIIDALKKDLNKAPLEAIMTEIGIVRQELTHMIKHFRHWAKPKRVKTPLFLFSAKSYIYTEPYGVVLIMSPWNYPFQLAIDPLIGAIAAGNCAIIKPGSYAKHTALAIEEMIKHTFPEEYITTVLGGREENQALLEQKFDYIFFTGSTSVARTVMEKAAVNLTPVSLELGGKSPCIVDGTLNMKLTAKRLAFGKFVNAGQTCVAPDYVFVKREYQNELIDELKNVIEVFFGKDPLNYPDFPKIINDKHHERLLGLIKNQHVVIGGKANSTTIEPTVLSDVNITSPVMQEEIFGPVLPLIPYDSIEEVITYINSKDRPLAFYLFSKDKNLEERLIRTISFGGGTMNDTLMHVASSELGFGGVGASGMGNYHGIHSFNTFSHHKSVLKRGTLVDLSFRYHPYSDSKQKIIDKFTK